MSRKDQINNFKKSLKTAKKSGAHIVGGGLFLFHSTNQRMLDDIPDIEDFRSRFELFEKAQIAFWTETNAFKGEKDYKAFCDELFLHEKEWLAFYSNFDNVEYAERTVGILGTLATLYRQRGSYRDCKKVLDIDEKVLDLYKATVESTLSEHNSSVECLRVLTFKFNQIVINLATNLNDYDKVASHLRWLIKYEIETGLHARKEDNYAFFLEIIGRPVNVAALGITSDEELITCARRAAAFLASEAPESLQPVAAQQLSVCPGCEKQERHLGDHLKCGRCKQQRYCSPECQRGHWAVHKLDCHRRENKTTIICAGCSSMERNPGEFGTCSNCLNARYCTRDCQRGDWKKHKKICRPPFADLSKSDC